MMCGALLFKVEGVKMKFIHIADVHFDMPMVALNGNKELAKKRRSEQKKAFHDVIQFAKQKKVDCLFIAGDLFEQKFVEKRTIDYIISNFQLIPEIPIFISPGNHDPLIKNSPYENVEWPENVTIFRKEFGLISLEEADIYGIGFEDYEMDDNLIPEITIEDEKKINILVTHGTLNGAMHQYQDIKEKDLKKFDYVALGHIHEKKIDDTRMIYPGSLLSCGFDEPGEHGFVYGEITKESCQISFHPLPYRKFEKMELDISQCTIISEALEQLKLGEDIYEIKIVGSRNFEVEDLIEAIREMNKNVCKIKDNTKMSYSLEDIQKENNLKGVFTRKILTEMEKMTEDEKQETSKIIDLVYQMMA